MITTTRGIMDESLLEKRFGVDYAPEADASWVEYWDGSELVHRSVNITIKEGICMKAEQETFGG